ncbi:MAG TPA: low affinity iron permease family protein [Ohtaekwangia sp.]|uniref:low affinity iron permease family protein n=1 Tax=Ohtaekwangia sp. TaxID=2066019 RepID=UPI002F92A685
MGTNGKKNPLLERFSSVVTSAVGSSAAFVVAVLLIIGWLVSGPFFHYSDTWQLVINTGTTIITFLMVFLIQRSQNKESIAINLKLNELVAAHSRASNRLVSVEDLTEEELKVLRKFYAQLAMMSKQDIDMQQTHSIEEAEELHEEKSAEQKE